MQKKEKNIFIVTITFMLVSLALMVTFNFISFYRNSVSNMEAVGTNSLTAEISEIKAYLAQGTNTLRVTSDNIDYMLNQNITPDDIERYLKFETTKFQEEIDKNFTGIYGFIGEQYVDGSDWIPPADYVPNEREWYIVGAEGNGDIVVVPPYVDMRTGEVITSVCRLLDDGKSVISIDITLNHLQEITEAINLNDMGYAFIVDDTGMVIAHNDTDEIGKNYLENEDMAELLMHAEKSEYFDTTLDGESIQVFTGEATENWRVCMIISSSKFLKSSRNLLVRNIIIVIIVYAVVIFFSIFAFRKLQETMEEIRRKEKQVENANKNLARSKDVISNLAYTNIITELKNRYALDDDIKERLATSFINIAYFDIDNFHSINETFGYDFGDTLLSEIAKKISEKFSKYAEIYNPFGTQFCLVYKGEISAKQAEEITVEVFETIKDKYLIGNIYVQPIVSGTVYRCSPKEFTSASAVLLKLEAMIKEIKRNGGNFCRTFIN